MNDPVVPIEQWPAALLLLINEKPRSLQALCIELVGQDPGESGHLPASMPMCIELNKVRQRMELWGLWKLHLWGNGMGYRYHITECGRRAAEALSVYGPQHALRYVATPDWLVQHKEREAARLGAPAPSPGRSFK